MAIFVTINLPEMKRLITFFIISIILLTPYIDISAQNQLWTKVEKAQKAGQPQTAAQYLRELENKAIAEGDSLEHYYIALKLMDNLNKYDWRQASEFRKTLSSLEKDFTGDELDSKIQKYSGHRRIMLLLYRQILRDKNDLDGKSTKCGNDYLDFRKRCLATLGSYPESEYSESIRNLVKQMDSKSFYAQIPNVMTPGDTVFSFNSVNVNSVKITLWRVKDGIRSEESKGKWKNWLNKNAVIEKSFTFKGFKNEYCIYESSDISVQIEKAGEYVVSFDFGEEILYENIYVTNIGGAMRTRNGNVEIYAANLDSGKPFNEAYVSVFSDGKAVGKVHCATDGFTPISWSDHDLSHSKSIRIESATDSYAPLIQIYKSYESRTSGSGKQQLMHSIAFTDRSLYTPGDSVYFKIICYCSDGVTGSVREGVQATVSLCYSGDDKPVATEEVTTGSMGSASGVFHLPAECRNGIYTITSDGNYLAEIRVESYSRPTFDIKLEQIAEALAFGDVIKQRGSVTDYTGHPVQGAVVNWTVTRQGGWRSGFSNEVIASGKVIAGNDGFFEIPFTASRPDTGQDDGTEIYSYFQVNATVTDTAGETHEKNSTICVSDRILELGISLPENDYISDRIIVDKDIVKNVTFTCLTSENVPFATPITWCLTNNGKVILNGISDSNCETDLDFSSIPSGDYRIEIECSFRGHNFRDTVKTAVLSRYDKKLPLESPFFYYRAEDSQDIVFALGTTEEDLFVEAELFDGDSILWHRHVHLKNGMELFTIPFEKEYPGSVTLYIFGFRKGCEIRRTDTFSKPNDVVLDVKLKDVPATEGPRSSTAFTVQAPAGSELTVTIYDITCDRFRTNSLYFEPLNRYVYNPHPSITTMLHSNVKGAMLYSSKNLGAGDAVYEEADSTGEEVAENLPELREDLGTLLAFIPHITTDSQGNAEITFDTGDLLSTFRIQVLAHDRNLRTGNATGTFTVNKDLVVSPHLPMFVTEGDHIVFRSRISNFGHNEISGKACIEVKDDSGKKLKGLEAQKMTLLAGAESEVAWTIDIPSSEKLSVSIWFDSKEGTDGETHEIVVIPASVTITDAISFVVGEHNFKYYERELRKRSGAVEPRIERAEYSTMDAVMEALPAPHRPESGNALDWISQLFISQMGTILRGLPDDEAFRSEAMANIAALQSSDGGLRWFGSMSPSTAVTLYFLEKTGQMRRHNAFIPDANEKEIITKAVRYIDDNLPFTISSAYIRSLWHDIPFTGDSKLGFDTLVNSTATKWQDLSILEKAQLCSLLMNCKEHFSFNEREMESRIRELSASLRDYAVIDKNAGCNFPNAVMPLRGLMNNELYAHSLLLQLFNDLGDRQMVRGLAQWILLQKHNQAWESTVSSTDAVAALVNSKADDLRLGAVYFTWHTPLEKLSENSNGISIERIYLRSDGTALSEGEVVKIGERIKARYTVHNDENRSFVRMDASRPSSFYPVDERSGSFYGGCQREIRADKSVFWWELLPEGETIWYEDFYVSQEGVITSGTVQVESLYAPEYRGHTSSMLITSEN